MNLENSLKGFFDKIKSSIQISDNDLDSEHLDKMMGGFKEAFTNSIKSSPDNSFQSPIGSFQSPVSSFQSPVSSFQSPLETLNIEPVKYGFWDFFKIVLAILIFSLLALNIFIYLKTGSDAFTYFFGKVANSEKKMINSGKKEDSESSDSVLSSLDLSAKKMSEDEKSSSSELRNIVENGLSGEKNTGDKNDPDYFEEDADDSDDSDADDVGASKGASKGASSGASSGSGTSSGTEDVAKKNKAGKNYSASSTLDLKFVKTPGYCYVGNDRNVRTCVKVGMGDTCVSGKVFPTMDVCINPNLKE
tara:strand:- start:10036 stop:10947 length:912 start_codon:yes stop_codon:yes gene_type:complete